MSGCEGLIQGGNYPSSMVGTSLNMPDGVDPFFERAFCTPGSPPCKTGGT